MIYKKHLLITVLLLLFNSISCRQNDSKKVSSIYKEQKNIKLEKLSCQEIIERVVKSSSLDLKLYKEYFVDIDNISSDSISIHVYFENNLSEDPKKKQIVESTIAWLLLIPKQKILYDVSVDPDNPIELKFDKKIVEENNIFSACNIVPKEIVNSNKSEQDYKFSILPFDFDDYYKTCVYPANDTLKCFTKYPKYIYKKGDAFSEIIKDKYNPTEYMYLPKISDYNLIILSNTDTDIETYTLIITKNNQIISSLNIGAMDESGILQFMITENYDIILYKRKNTLKPKIFFKKYSINKDGKIVEKR